MEAFKNMKNLHNEVKQELETKKQALKNLENEISRVVNGTFGKHEQKTEIVELDGKDFVCVFEKGYVTEFFPLTQQYFYGEDEKLDQTKLYQIKDPALLAMVRAGVFSQTYTKEDFRHNEKVSIKRDGNKIIGGCNESELFEYCQAPRFKNGEPSDYWLNANGYDTMEDYRNRATRLFKYENYKRSDEYGRDLLAYKQELQQEINEMEAFLSN